MSDLLPDILQWSGGKLDFSAGTVVMGILNVTADSFSDGGQFLDEQRAVEHAAAMADAGAAIIDIGAESTRPGAKPVPSQRQIERVIPIIRALAKKINIPISIDTYDHAVAKAAVEAGASMINDVTALKDPRMAEFAAEKNIPVILMHMLGTPQTMQKNPQYEDVVDEVLSFLLERAELGRSFGIANQNIFIDPGIGFGKTVEHNLLLLKNIGKFIDTGYRVLIGTSRKRFIGRITEKDQPQDRAFGTAATVALAAAAGVSIVRVHDVGEMVDVVKMIAAVKNV